MTVFRRILPAEIRSYRAHLLRLSMDDRRARFMGAVSDDAVDAHCQRIDWSRAVIVAAFVRGEIRGATELRLEKAGAQEGELAVSVEQDWQGQGIGTTLVRRVLTIARNRGIRRLCVVCLPENRRMQRIATTLLGPCAFAYGEVSSHIELPPPTPITLAQEALDRSTLPLSVMLDQWQGEPARAA